MTPAIAWAGFVEASESLILRFEGDLADIASAAQAALEWCEGCIEEHPDKPATLFAADQRDPREGVWLERSNRGDIVQIEFRVDGQHELTRWENGKVLSSEPLPKGFDCWLFKSELQTS